MKPKMMENYHEGQAKKEEEGSELEKDGGFSFRRMEDVSSCGVVFDQIDGAIFSRMKHRN